MILNTKHPDDEDTVKLRSTLEEKYDVPVLIMDVLNLTEDDIHSILSHVLFEFPITEIRMDVPKWVLSLRTIIG